MNQNAWRRMVEAAFYDEGVRGFDWESTGSNHRRASGTITVPGGKEVRVSVVVSGSPSDYRAIHRVRANLRTAIHNARRIHDGGVPEPA